MDSKAIEMVTVEEAMQAISEALRFLADNITEMLDALVYDECRDERRRVNGMSDLEEQLQVVTQMLEHEDSFESRASLLRDVIERYQEGSHLVDIAKRDQATPLLVPKNHVNASEALEQCKPPNGSKLRILP